MIYTIFSESQDFLDKAKSNFGPADADIKDAKRRISLVKGPKKRKEPAPVVENANDDDDGNDESASETSDAEDDQ